MGTVKSQFGRIQPVTANAGAGEKKLLSAGGEGNGYKGTLDIGKDSLSQGDKIRIEAWGTWENPDNVNGTVEFRLYFNHGADITIAPILLVAAPPIAPVQNNIIPWHYTASLTVSTTGASGNGTCEGFVLNMPRFGFTLGFGQLPAIDTTVDNDFELTAKVVAHGSVELYQCSVEPLPLA